jgi:endonuclease YncB( thermonuclease family)
VGYVAAMLIVAGLIVGDRMGVFGRPKQSEYRPDAATIARNNTADRRTYHDKSFKVTGVVDGDTLDVDVRDEVLGKRSTRIRLWGVDTPETVKPNTPKQHFGTEASRFTRNFCMDKTVRLELVKGRDTRGKYGRLLAYVSLPAAGERPLCLNAELIRRGYGYCDPRYPHPRKADFRDLQRRARQSGVGLWADAGDDDLPYYYRGKIKLGQ